MSNGMNIVIVAGNLGRDAELKTLQNGNAVLSFSVGCNESYTDKNNQKQERCEWIKCDLWGKRATALAPYLKKGKSVCVKGAMRTSTYEKNGEKRYSTSVNVNEIMLMGGERGGGANAGEDAPRRAPAQTEYAAEHFAGDDIPF